jgi:hypothetical protein
VVDGHRGILEPAPHKTPGTQFCHLTAAARYWVLMAFATRLGIVDRAKTFVSFFNFVKGFFVRSVGGVICDTIAKIIESSRRFNTCCHGRQSGY